MSNTTTAMTKTATRSLPKLPYHIKKLNCSLFVCDLKM